MAHKDILTTDEKRRVFDQHASAIVSALIKNNGLVDTRDEKIKKYISLCAYDLAYSMMQDRERYF